MEKPFLAFEVEYNGLARELKSHGKIADPILKKEIVSTNQFLWDTGATRSCISRRIAEKLNLPAIGSIEVRGANGRDICDVHVIHMILPNNLTVREVEVASVNLECGSDLIVGMDVIALGDFHIQNVKGKTTYTFIYPPFPRKISFLKEVSSRNYRNSKRLQRKKKKR